MSVPAAPNIQLPPIDDILGHAHVVVLPMAVRFRGVTIREAFLINGPVTWGEFVPFPEYEALEAAAWLRSAIECAYVGLPTPKREFVEVNAIISVITPEQVSEIVGCYPGCRMFKIKIAEGGQSLNDDIEHVAAVRTAMAEAYDYESVVRMDANRGWPVEQAIRAAHELGPLEYTEQPVATVTELREARDAVGDFCPIAADEPIRKVGDPHLVAREQAADVGVMEVALLSGPRRLLRLAEELEMKVAVANALDTGVSMAAGLFTTVALPATELQPEPNTAGLATSSLFIEDVIEPRPLIDGRSPVTNPALDPSRLAELAASGPRRDWWFDRLRAVYAHLQRHSTVVAHHLLQHSEHPEMLTPFMAL